MAILVGLPGGFLIFTTLVHEIINNADDGQLGVATPGTRGRMPEPSHRRFTPCAPAP